jgi:hypothetical protein
MFINHYNHHFDSWLVVVLTILKNDGVRQWERLSLLVGGFNLPL